ncbi:hypothetical protein ACQY0O_003637 [Thecaphora frezii]
MSVQTLTVTAIPAFPTNFPPDHVPGDLVVTSTRRVNSTLPFLLTAAMAVGLIIADWSLHLPWEFRLLRSRSRWKLSHLAYFCSRIGGFGVSVAAVLHQFVGNLRAGPETQGVGVERWHYANFACNAAKRSINTFTFISIAGSTGILLLRCLALWRFKRSILIPLLLLWIASPVLFFVNIFNLSSKSRCNGLTPCAALPPKLKALPVLVYMPWFVLPVFDSTILVLSLIGLHRATAKRDASRLERMFRFDNMLYYAVTLITVIPIPIWYLVAGRDGRMMVYTSLYVSLSSVLSCRIFINLWKAIGRELALEQSFVDDALGASTGTAYSSQRRTQGGATSIGVPTMTAAEARASRSIATHRSRGDASDDEHGGLEISEAAAASSSSLSSSSSVHQDSFDVEDKQHHRVVPQWADVDADLAFSLRGAHLLETGSLDEDKEVHGLRSSP